MRFVVRKQLKGDDDFPIYSATSYASFSFVCADFSLSLRLPLCFAYVAWRSSSKFGEGTEKVSEWVSEQKEREKKRVCTHLHRSQRLNFAAWISICFELINENLHSTNIATATHRRMTFFFFAALVCLAICLLQNETVESCIYRHCFFFLIRFKYTWKFVWTAVVHSFGNRWHCENDQKIVCRKPNPKPKSRWIVPLNMFRLYRFDLVILIGNRRTAINNTALSVGMCIKPFIPLHDFALFNMFIYSCGV